MSESQSILPDMGATPPPGKFQWIDRLNVVEALAGELADNGGNYSSALRTIRIRDYCYNITKMPAKQRDLLRRDARQRAKEILQERESAEVGDIVRVPKLIPNVLGGYRRDGRRLHEAVIVDKYTVSGIARYRVRRLADGGEQQGNGHMIKAIVRRHSPATHAEEG